MLTTAIQVATALVTHDPMKAAAAVGEYAAPRILEDLLFEKKDEQKVDAQKEEAQRREQAAANGKPDLDNTDAARQQQSFHTIRQEIAEIASQTEREEVEVRSVKLESRIDESTLGDNAGVARAELEAAARAAVVRLKGGVVEIPELSHRRDVVYLFEPEMQLADGHGSKTDDLFGPRDVLVNGIIRFPDGDVTVRGMRARTSEGATLTGGRERKAA